MPTIRKSITRLAAFLAALFFVACLSLGILIYAYRDFILKTVLEFVITEATGFRTEVDTLQHEWPAIFTLRGVKMDNPGGYTRRVFARAPYFYIDLDLRDIVERRSFHIRHWRLIISELHLEKNRAGITNGALLKSIKKLGGGGGGEGGGKGLAFLMDRLEVKIQRITYQDRTGVLPKKFTAGLYLPAHIYENVTDFKRMVDRITDKVLQLAGPSKIVKLSPFVLEGSLKKAAVTAKETTAAVTTAPGKVVKTTAHGAKEKFTEVTEMTKEQLEKLKLRRRPPA